MSAAAPSLVADALALVDGLVSRGVPPAEAANLAASLMRGEPTQRLLSPAELAVVVGRSTSRVKTWIQNEQIPVVRTGDGVTIGVHLPTFLAVCTHFAQPRGSRNTVRAGEVAARLVGGGSSR